MSEGGQRGQEADFDDYETGDGCDYYFGCDRCGGRGFYVSCIDDMCNGQEECIHGDGYSTCPCMIAGSAARSAPTPHPEEEGE